MKITLNLNLKMISKLLLSNINLNLNQPKTTLKKVITILIFLV